MKIKLLERLVKLAPEDLLQGELQARMGDFRATRRERPRSTVACRAVIILSKTRQNITLAKKRPRERVSPLNLKRKITR